MRFTRDDQAVFEFTPQDSDQIQYMSVLEEILRGSGDVEAMIWGDLLQDAREDRGRKGMNARQVLRLAMIKQMEQCSYVKLYSRVSDSVSLRRFCGYEFDNVHKANTIQENIKKITPATFEELNKVILRVAKRLGVEDGSKIRVDCTAVETNIHYPTDSRLLEDAIRVITRIIKRNRQALSSTEFTFHDRSRVAKKLSFKIANTKGVEAKEELYKKFLLYAEEVLKYGKEAAKQFRAVTRGPRGTLLSLKKVGQDLSEMSMLLKKIINQTRRRVILKKTVPAGEKVLSIFEPHTDIIEKGGRKTEFGHKICVTVGKTNLVLDCQIEEGNPADTTLYKDALDRNKSFYGRVAKEIATDGGFSSLDNAQYAKKLGVEKIAFSKRVGIKMKEILGSKTIQRLLAKFRAGVEGIISVLKRARGLGRCIWSGWESFQSYVWSSIAAHNLRMVTLTIIKSRSKKLQKAR